MITRRQYLAATAILATPKLAHAAWPDRPVRLIVPFPPGSGTDVLARFIAEPFAKQLGQPVVIDNRPGGNGVVGAQAGATAAPNGLTLTMLGTSAAAINPHTIRRLPYDPLKDFAPIGGVAHQPYVLVIDPNRPERDLPSFLEAGRRNPNGLTFSTGNAGSLIMGHMLGRAAGIKVTPVPYRGGAEAAADVSAGRIDFNLADFHHAMSQDAGGRLRAIAVTTGQAFPLAPRVPPLSSALPGFDANVWFSMAAPAATPSDIIAAAGAALQATLADAELARRLTEMGLVPMPKTPAEMKRHMEEQIVIWGQRVAAAGIEPQ
jgi:tripartite-type tricarboxylate transporter receptor subunit TctC